MQRTDRNTFVIWEIYVGNTEVILCNMGDICSEDDRNTLVIWETYAGNTEEIPL